MKGKEEKGGQRLLGPQVSSFDWLRNLTEQNLVWFLVLEE